MKVRSKVLGAMILVFFFGGIALSAVLGFWQTESAKVPAAFTEGAFEGMPDPADIRGSYSFADVAEAFGVPPGDLLAAFGLPEGTDPAGFQNKELEDLYGGLAASGTEVGNGSVKLFTALYAGLPYALEEDTYLPLEAVEILKAKASLTEEQTAYLDAHGVDIGPFKPGSSAELEEAAETEPDEAAEETERLVKGTTTIGEVLAWGVAPEALEEILQGPLPAKTLSIRDYCTEKGLDFGTVKEALQSRIDALE